MFFILSLENSKTYSINQKYPTINGLGFSKHFHLQVKDGLDNKSK